MRKPELYIRCGCINAEGPVWDERTQTLYFIDVEAGRIFSQKYTIPGMSEPVAAEAETDQPPASGSEEKAPAAEAALKNPAAPEAECPPLTVMEMGEKIGCAVLCEEGGLIAATESGFWHVDFPDGKKQFLCDPEAHLPQNRFNDGKADPQGRLIAGTMTMNAPADAFENASLYRLEAYPKGTENTEPAIIPEGAESSSPALIPDGSENSRPAIIPDDSGYRAVRLLSGICLSNGLAWSADGRLFYHADTGKGTITQYAYDPETGSIGSGTVVIRIPRKLGFPDGMTIDEEGCLWIALWEGASVTRWNPETGKLLDTIPLPVPNVTCCCFGGPGMDELFITTASQDTDTARWPLAGHVFRAFPGVKGAPSYRCALQSRK